MKHFVYILFLGLIIASGGCDQADRSRQKAEQPVRPVRYITLEAESSDHGRTFSGTAEAARESVLSFKVAGTVTSIPVKVGDRVNAGDLLAELDKTDLMVDVESARAGVETSRADVKSAESRVYTIQSTYERIRNLYENGNVSLNEFEQTRGDFETAKAQLQAAESRVNSESAKLKAAQNQLQYTRLTAPFDGVINRIAVEENEEVSSGEAIVTLSGLEKLEVKVSVSDLYITRITTGMACRITFPALPGTEFKGVVTEVPYAADDAPTYPVTVGIEDQDARLRPGMAAQVLFLFDAAAGDSGMYAPADGVGEEKGENFVFVIEPGEQGRGTAHKRRVVLGALTGKGFRVKEGLLPGEMVATSGLQLLMDGMAVKLLDDPVKEW